LVNVADALASDTLSHHSMEPLAAMTQAPEGESHRSVQMGLLPRHAHSGGKCS
jgi:hypothetical protein